MRYCSRYFKTSHVIVYLEFRDRFLCKIHYFKTSHVIVYRSICRFLRIRLCNFKTSHVIVYLRIFLCFFLIVVSFQNISCYCLSLIFFPFFRCLCYFKTSHVIVYLCFLVLQFLLSSTFQNISCYCLSIPDTDEAFEMVEFQNISCYCLSGYQAVCNCKSDISKHLMLLFIYSGSKYAASRRKFQNISCYCLSAPMPPLKAPVIHFKTSHVIVYHLQTDHMP